MKRIKTFNVFLFFTLMSLIFVCLFPVYFSYGEIRLRTIGLPERVLSLMFVLLWLALCVYAAWKRRLPLLIGGILYSVMAYVPGWFLPGLIRAAEKKEPGMAASAARFFFERLYEMTGAPLAGVSLLVSEKASQSLAKWLLPMLALGYAGTQLFRFYRNAYLADQLHLDDSAGYSNPELARELGIAMSPGRITASGQPMPPVQGAPSGRQIIPGQGTPADGDALREEKQQDIISNMLKRDFKNDESRQ